MCMSLWICALLNHIPRVEGTQNTIHKQCMCLSVRLPVCVCFAYAPIMLQKIFPVCAVLKRACSPETVQYMIMQLAPPKICIPKCVFTRNVRSPTRTACGPAQDPWCSTKCAPCSGPLREYALANIPTVPLMVAILQMHVRVCLH